MARLFCGPFSGLFPGLILGYSRALHDASKG